MCFVWIWEQTEIISLYSINWLVFITETERLLRGTELCLLNVMESIFVFKELIKEAFQTTLEREFQCFKQRVWYSTLCGEHFTVVHCLVILKVVLAQCVIFYGGSRHPLSVGTAAYGSFFFSYCVSRKSINWFRSYVVLIPCTLRSRQNASFLGKINFTEVVKFLSNACNCMSILV